jgi:hypothetical protein
VGEIPLEDEAPTVSLARVVASARREPSEPERRSQLEAEEEAARDTCETCGAPLDGMHEHLVDPAARALRCACDVCARVESSRAGASWARVPPRASKLDGFTWEDGAWDRLGIPIGLAFFLRSSASGGVVALYPSPAGAVEAAIEAEAWEEVMRANGAISVLGASGALAADVEALLAYRVGERRAYYLVSIDRAYALVGVLRKHWRGLSGGGDAWREIATFFARLESGGVAHA